MSNEIPAEIRQLDSWMLGNANKVPCAITGSGRWVAASVADSANWYDYATVAEACESGVAGDGCLPGFVLHDGHEYAVIDIDIKNESNCSDRSKWITPERLDYANRLIEHIGSYTEYSRSGVGYHIWVKVPAAMTDRAQWTNVRRNGIEIYFRSQFILCTGNAVEGYDIPIVDASDKVADLLRKIVPEKSAVEQEGGLASTCDVDDEMDDDDVIDELLSCKNADLYRELWDGDWEGRYESQSEADAALIEGLLFVSESKSQAERIFMRSGLAQRDKANRNGYVKGTVKNIAYKIDLDDAINEKIVRNSVSSSLISIRPPKSTVEAASIDNSNIVTVAGHEVDLSSCVNQADVVNAVMSVAASDPNVGDLIHSALDIWNMNQSSAAKKYEPPKLSDVESVSPFAAVKGRALKDFGSGESVDLKHPPGVLGDLSRWITRHCVKPTKEPAIAAVLGYASGIMGKAWQINGTGLNNYIVMIGQSAVGKSSATKAVGILHNKVSERVPQAAGMFGASVPGSDIGLLRICEKNDSLTMRMDEFAKKIGSATSGKSGPDKHVMDELLRMYDKSDHGERISSVVYSDVSKTINIPHNVAVSIIGDGVSSVYYSSLSGVMAEDGLLSRLTVIEYTGIRQYTNRNRVMEVPEYIINKFVDIATDATSLNATGKYINVIHSADAAVMLEAIDDESDDMVNYQLTDSTKYLASRRKLKIERIAALLAVADNHHYPKIEVEHVEWARDVIDQGIARELWWLRQGVVAGNVNDADMEDLLLDHLKRFIAAPTGDKTTVELAKRGVLRLVTVRDIARTIPAIAQSKSGFDKEYRRIVSSLTEIGALKRHSRKSALNLFGINTRQCYSIGSEDDSFDN